MTKPNGAPHERPCPPFRTRAGSPGPRRCRHPGPLPRHPVPPDAEPVTFRFALAGLRWGREGPLVLALHGWEGRAAQFRTLAARLVPMGYRVLALDAPAHGRSPGREADPVVFADALQE